MQPVDRYKREPEPRKPTVDDELQAEATAAAGDGIIEQLKRMQLDKTLRQLTREEVDHLACGAISGWVMKRTEQQHGRQSELTELLKTLDIFED